MWTSAPGTYECTHNSLVGQVQGWDGQGSLGLLLVQLSPWSGSVCYLAVCVESRVGVGLQDLRIEGSIEKGFP